LTIHQADIAIPTISGERMTGRMLLDQGSAPDPFSVAHGSPSAAPHNGLNPANSRSLRAVADDGDVTQTHLLGVIVSSALLSLGAPFWYDMLKNLLKLRPAPAIAEEKQRDERARETRKS
jgi:hypothetical protein